MSPAEAAARAAAPDTAEFLPLTPAVFHILLSLADSAKHGYGVIVDVRERTQGAIRLGTGTLYTAVKRLLEQGLIVETESTTVDTRRQSAYAITELGSGVLRAEAERLEGMVDLARAVLPATGGDGP